MERSGENLHRFATFFMGALVLLCCTPGMILAADTPTGRNSRVGTHLGPLEFSDLAGSPHRIDWDTGERRATIIFFFEPRCADCFEEMVYFDALYRTAGEHGLAVYGVDGSGRSPEEVDESLTRYRRLYSEPAFSIVPDPNYELSALLEVQGLPSTFLIEKHGIVVSHCESFEDEDAVDLTRKIEVLTRIGRGRYSPVLQQLAIKEGSRPAEAGNGAAAGAAEGAETATDPPSVGDTASPFDYTSLEGEAGRWDTSLAPKPFTIVFFWGALCHPCIQEMVFLDEIFAATRDLGLRVYAVEATGLGPERTAEVMKRYERLYPHPSFTIVPDPEYRLAGIFGVGEMIPQTFFIDREGSIVYHTDNFIQGHEAGFMRKIEIGLNLRDGALDDLKSLPPGASSAVPPFRDGVGEASAENAELLTHRVEGDKYYNRWELDKALEHYLKFLEYDPDFVPTRERVATICESRGDTDGALAHWNKILELEPLHSLAASKVKSLSR